MEAQWKIPPEHLPEMFHRYRPEMDGITRPGDVVVKVEPSGTGQWRIVVMSIYQRGILAVILGLLAVFRYSVREGRFFILKEDRDCAKTKTPGKIVSVFTILPEDEKRVGPETRQAFETVLCGMIRAAAGGRMNDVREKLIEDLSGLFSEMRDSRQTLLPITVEYDTRASDAATGLHIISQDTPGFLFALANSLAMLNINIEQGRIHVPGEEADITLWVVRPDGEKIQEAAELKQLQVASVLINQFTHLLPFSADPAQALRQFKEFVDHILNHPEWTRDFDSFKSQDVMAVLAKIMGVSQFLWNDFLRMQHENLFPLIRNPEHLDYSPNRKEMLKDIQKELDRAADTEERAEILNQFKDREMFRIDLRHITRRITDIRFSRELTELTDVVVGQAVSLCYDQLALRYGRPRLKNNEICNFSVLSAGKFGGAEMGFASDIELFFVYEGTGETDGRETTTNSFFFEMLVKQLLKKLKSKQNGIFEIDLRLRPFGDKGTLASSLDAFSEYYSVRGAAMQFEKMALVKLRPITGTDSFQKQIMEIRDAFSYSGRPVDYENIKRLRQLQIDTYVKKGEIHAKYGPGGLVDFEYFVQACQMDHGSRLPGVRETNTILALARLVEEGIVSEKTSLRIRTSYQCLRRVIDALRIVRGNAKDLHIPDTGSKTFHYLARRMGYDKSSELASVLRESMAFGSSLWEMPRVKS